MADSIALPASLLTREQYEKSQFDQKYNVEKDLGRDAFLKLFTTQLQNQNPLQPMDNEAFVSQLAQFSSLESMKAMQSSIEQMSASFQGEKLIGSSNLLGRYVRNDAATVMAGKGEKTEAVVELLNSAAEVQIRVLNSMGQEVYGSTQGAQSPGEMKITWNGEDAEGKAVPAGIYKFVVAAKINDKFMPVPVRSMDRIHAVHWDSASNDYTVETDSGRILNSKQITRIEM
jgi:flagellar basal-body rod modification protein FlgD